MTSRGQKFTKGDAFIGYQRDTPAAVVFQATNLLKEKGPAVSSWKLGRMKYGSIRGLKAEEEHSVVWKTNVSFYKHACMKLERFNEDYYVLTKIMFFKFW